MEAKQYTTLPMAWKLLKRLHEAVHVQISVQLTLQITQNVNYHLTVLFVMLIN